MTQQSQNANLVSINNDGFPHDVFKGAKWDDINKHLKDALQTGIASRPAVEELRKQQVVMVSHLCLAYKAIMSNANLKAEFDQIVSVRFNKHDPVANFVKFMFHEAYGGNAPAMSGFEATAISAIHLVARQYLSKPDAEDTVEAIAGYIEEKKSPNGVDGLEACRIEFVAMEQDEVRKLRIARQVAQVDALRAKEKAEELEEAEEARKANLSIEKYRQRQAQAAEKAAQQRRDTMIARIKTHLMGRGTVWTKQKAEPGTLFVMGDDGKFRKLSTADEYDLIEGMIQRDQTVAEAGEQKAA